MLPFFRAHPPQTGPGNPRHESRGVVCRTAVTVNRKNAALDQDRDQAAGDCGFAVASLEREFGHSQTTVSPSQVSPTNPMADISRNPYDIH